MRNPAKYTRQQTSLLAAISIILFGIAYYPAFQILIKKWLNSDEYFHAFLTLPIIFYMGWSKRSLLLETPILYPFTGLVLLIGSSLFYIFALLTQVHTIIFLSMLASVFGAILYFKGIHGVKILLTPLFLFAVLIPVPNQLYVHATFPLQLMVSQVSEIIIQWFGVPAFRDGNIITTPDTSFAVVDACSGLRSMIALITLSIIIGFFSLSKKISKLLLITASIPTAILINIIRVVTIIAAMHFLNIDLTKGIMHTIAGVLIFFMAVFILYLLQRVIEPCSKELN